MTTFTKKSLSVVLAVLMAISTLTVGAMTAFAADVSKYVAVAEGVTALTKEENYVAFTPATSDMYDITVTKTVDNKNVYASFNARAIDNFGDWDDDFYCYASSSSYSVEKAREATEDNQHPTGTTWTEVYTPATVVAKLEAGKTYYITVNKEADEVATLSISKTEYSYGYTQNYGKLSYVYDYKEDAEGNYDYNAPIIREKKDACVGYAIAIRGYYGTATSVAYPATINNLPVVEVNGGFASSSLRKKITAVVIPEGVKRVDNFDGMYALSSVSLPASLETIGYEAFAHDHALAGRFVIPAGVKNVYGNAFYDTALDSVVVSSSETEIEYHAFGYKDVLDDATPNPNDTTFAKVDGFMVLAEANSFAELYAIQNGFVTYDPAQCALGNHPYNTVTTDSTYFAKGSIVSTCPVCGVVATQAIAKKTLKKFKISSLKSSKKGVLVVKAAKQKDATGFQIQYSTSKKFAKKSTKTVNVKTTKALAKTIKGLKSGKKYYVRVRSYKTSGKKTVYSSYTSAKNVKVK